MNMLVPPVVPRPNGPTDAEIIAIVGRAAFENGGFHAARGGVGQIVLSADGSVLQAQTIGSASRPNHQSVTLRAGPDGQVTFRGLCSCSARINCAHVAAALLAARRARILQLPPEARFSPEATVTPARAAPVLPANPAPLDYRLVAWLDSLPAARHAESEDYPEDVRHRIFYVLSRQPDGRGVGRLKIEAFTGQLRKDGSIGKNVHPLRLDYGAGRITRTRTMRPSDLLLLARLAQRRGDTPSLEDDPSETLARILATGRARYATPDGPVLAEGPARPGRLVWRMRADGAQLPELEADAGMPVAVPDPWYLDPDSGTAGPLSLDLPPRLAAKLLDAPPLPPLQAAQVGAELARRLPGLAVPAPQPPPPIEDLTGPPRPVLTLTRGPHPTANPWGPAMPDVPLARLDFRYGPVTLGRAREPAPLTAHGGRLYRVQRDAAREAQALARLGGFGLGAPHVSVWGEREGGVLLPDDTSHAGWLQLLVHALPALRAEGWEVAVAPDFPIRLVTADDDGAIAAEIDSGADGSGIDWLDLHLGVRIDGARVDLVPALVHLIGAFRGELPGAIAAADPAAIFTLPLLDGRILTLQLGRIRPILLALVDLFGAGAIDPDNARLRFTRHEAAELAALEQATPDLVWQGGEAVRELGRQLRAAGGAIPEVALPGTFQGSLRPYQQQGVGWLQFLRAAGLGGVLADDMGLGKTVQTLAHLAIEQAAGRLDRPALIVCPTSLVANWRAEAERFAPGLRLLALHGPERKRDFAAIPACDVVLTTYPLLTRDHAVLAAQAWHILVLDEAQSIKNPLATTTRAVVGLEARQRLCLSGTPLQNHLGELWSLFDFLAPGFLGSARSFRSRYRVPVEKNGDAEARTRLARRVRPFLLRRTKEEVASDLPAKTEIIESVEMEPAQQAMYEAIRLAMHERVREAIAERGLARSGIVILDALLKLRQVCCDPRLVKLRTAHKAGSAKLERLMEMLGELIGQGRRVLLFSQFTSMLDLIIARLHDAGTRFVLLTGDTQDRATPVRRFQAGEVPLFLLSLKAGGTGLNLTAADTVIHYDPWWNPAVEDQATDRAHRIGQSKPVFVHRMVTLGSIEEKMELLKSRKRALVDGILAAEQGGALRLTEADIEALFAA